MTINMEELWKSARLSYGLLDTLETRLSFTCGARATFNAIIPGMECKFVEDALKINDCITEFGRSSVSRGERA